VLAFWLCQLWIIACETGVEFFLLSRVRLCLLLNICMRLFVSGFFVSCCHFDYSTLFIAKCCKILANHSFVSMGT